MAMTPAEAVKAALPSKSERPWPAEAAEEAALAAAEVAEETADETAEPIMDEEAIDEPMDDEAIDDMDMADDEAIEDCGEGERTKRTLASGFHWRSS